MMKAKAKAIPLYFANINEREQKVLDGQLVVLQQLYGDVAEFLPPITLGTPLPPEADVVVFPQLIGEAFSAKDALEQIDLPIFVITSEFGTVEMWDWEIVTFLRDLGLSVFSPYNTELARSLFRAVAVKKEMQNGLRFLMFQDDPGEGMQAGIFKRFFWWEPECTKLMEDTFGLNIVYKSYKELSQKAKEVSDDAARAACANWNVAKTQDVSEKSYLSAVKMYVAAKKAIAETGDIAGIGANCLNESFHSDTTPCLAWSMLFEYDDVLWACEGDTLTMVSKYIFYSILKQPIMMTNIYPSLVGMAAMKHEKLDAFPPVDNIDNHALCAHCGYFGLAPRAFCTEWTVKPKVLGIVDENAIMVDCRFAKGPITLAKLSSNMKKITLIECEIANYVQYPGTDCVNGALLRYKNNNGHEIMDSLSSHHALLIQGDHIPTLLQAARIFGFEVQKL